MTSQAITCPQCGSTSVKLIGAHRESALAVTSGNPESQQGKMRYAYQCQCGMAFTRAEKADHPLLGSAERPAET